LLPAIWQVSGDFFVFQQDKIFDSDYC